MSEELKLAAIPVIMGLAAYARYVLHVNSKLVPLLVVGLWIVFNCIVNGNTSFLTILKGAGLGFTTVGLYSGVKNTTELWR